MVCKGCLIIDNYVVYIFIIPFEDIMLMVDGSCILYILIIPFVCINVLCNINYAGVWSRKLIKKEKVANGTKL